MRAIRLIGVLASVGSGCVSAPAGVPSGGADGPGNARLPRPAGVRPPAAGAARRLRAGPARAALARLRGLPRLPPPVRDRLQLLAVAAALSARLRRVGVGLVAGLLPLAAAA